MNVTVFTTGGAMATKFDVLADCLEARSRGEDVAPILAQYPGFRAEIEHIMSTVERIRRSVETFHRQVPTPALDLPVIEATTEERQHALRLAWGIMTMGYAALSLFLVGLGALDTQAVGASLVGLVCWLVWWTQCQPRPDQHLGVSAR